MIRVGVAVVVGLGLVACEATVPSWIEEAPEAELSRECAPSDTLADGPSIVGSWGPNIGLTYDDIDVEGWTACWRYVPRDGNNNARAEMALEATEVVDAVGNEAQVRVDGQPVWDRHDDVGEGTLDFVVNGETVMSMSGDFTTR